MRPTVNTSGGESGSYISWPASHRTPSSAISGPRRLLGRRRHAIRPLAVNDQPTRATSRR